MNTETLEKNELVLLVEKSGLEPETANSLRETFLPFYEQALEWNERAKTIKVTDATQLTEMKQAREARLSLKAIRGSVESRRKELKEDSLKKGKAIDGVANVLKALIEPTEAYLQEQEDFAKIAEAKRKEALKTSRIELLSPYNIQTDFYDLANMPEDAFGQLLSNTIKNHEDAIEAKRKEEEERIAREQEEIKERERIRLENEQLKKEKEERENEIRAKNQLRNERTSILSKYKYTHPTDVADLTDDDFTVIAEEAQDIFNEEEKKRIEAEQAEAEAREQREAELLAEREKNARIARELSEKREAEEKAKREAEEKEQAELSMGDKAKFQKLINEMESLKGKYAFKSKKYKALGESVDELLNKTINWAISKQ